MKFVLSLLAVLASTTSFANDTLFKCTAPASVSSAYLAINASEVTFADTSLSRDKSYIPGNSHKRYHRYISPDMDILIPTLMVKNKINQGVIVVYTATEKIRFSCIK